MIITCRTCHGEGFIEHGHTNAPDAELVEPCEQCEGTGAEVIAAELITDEDFADWLGKDWQ